MKLWRKEAAKHNAEAGEKHRGRAYKVDWNRNSGYIPDLLRALFIRAGIKLKD